MLKKRLHHLQNRLHLRDREKKMHCTMSEHVRTYFLIEHTQLTKEEEKKIDISNNCDILS